MNITHHHERSDAATAAARQIAQSVSQALAQNGRSTIALSGGSTPLATYALLSQQPLEWGKVTCALTDERDVPTTHPDSNEKMLRENLLKNHAAGANFQSLDSMEAPPKFTSVLLGMGSDGHIASIFPDSPHAATALGLNAPAGVLKITTPSSPHARTTLNLSALINADHITLLIFGEDKLARIQQPARLPVHEVLQQSHSPVEVIWAP